MRLWRRRARADDLADLDLAVLADMSARLQERAVAAEQLRLAEAKAAHDLQALKELYEGQLGRPLEETHGRA